LGTPRDIRLPVLADEQAAARLAQRIAAQMVIYGAVRMTDEGEQLDLRFFVAPTLPDETNLLLGAHVLGRPLGLPDGTGDDVAANVVVAERLRTRSQALALLVTGLTQQILGRTAEALATFRQAETALTQWPDEAGKEVLYFLIGREELFLGHVDQAEQALLRAVTINPEYARGQAALGSVYFVLAQKLPAADRGRPPGYLEQAAQRQQLAVELAQRQAEPLVEALAHVALAKTHRLQAETAYLLDQFDEARRAFTRVDEELAQAIPTLETMRQHRLLAQAYETQGAARLQMADLARRTGDRQQAKTALDQARTAYLACIAQGQEDDLDQLLDDLIIAQHCRPNLAIVAQVEEQLEEQP
jgi:tetratricopeptide (TPR) repeat protein